MEIILYHKKDGKLLTGYTIGVSMRKLGKAKQKELYGDKYEEVYIPTKPNMYYIKYLFKYPDGHWRYESTNKRSLPPCKDYNELEVYFCK